MVKFGIFDHLDDSGIGLAAQYAQRLTIVEACDQAGFHAYHLAEHHGTPHGLAPSPNLFLSAVAQRTRRLRLGPLVMLLTLQHPLRAFEEICMLDQLSGGRVEFGIGRGTSALELGFFEVEEPDAQDRFLEAIDIILRAMAGGTLDYRGHYYKLRNVPIGLRPLQRPHPPIWYGTNRCETAVWAARNGVNLASFGKASAVRMITDAYRAHALALDPIRMPLLGMTRHVVIAETDSAAQALAAPAYARWFNTLTQLDRMHNLSSTPKLPATFDEAVATGECIAGSAETVRELIRQQVRDAGITYLLCQVAFGDLPLCASLATIAALQSEIMPSVAEANGSCSNGQMITAPISSYSPISLPPRPILRPQGLPQAITGP